VVRWKAVVRLAALRAAAVCMPCTHRPGGASSAVGDGGGVQAMHASAKHGVFGGALRRRCARSARIGQAAAWMVGWLARMCRSST